MTVEQTIKGLQVVVRGGGNIISHRPVFSHDGSILYLIQSSRLLSYSTKTCLLTGTYTTPGASPIANVHVKPNNTVVILTSAGAVLSLEPPPDSRVSSVMQINMAPAHWIPITNFTSFLCPRDELPEYEHYLVVGYPQDAVNPVLYSVDAGDGEITKMCWDVVATQHSVGVSGDGRFVVAIQEGTLFCKDMRDAKNCKWHSSGTRKLTCVAVHPTEEFVCATGDDSGRILIWTNVMVAQSPAKTVFHWHTLPVVDLAFSPEGSQMFSGGGECTLVKWDRSDSTNKRTLPRMGLPIAHIGCSTDGDLVAVAHSDNCVHIVDSYSKVVGVVKNFTCSDGGGGSTRTAFPAGVNVDPVDGCLVLNGRPGWLQAFDWRRNAHVYDLDVCQQNYVTAERGHQIPNGVVTVVGFSKGGGWMGTGEARGGEEQGQRVSESRLKFWKRDLVKGVWVLNTCIEWPHCGGGAFRGLRFRPVNDDGDIRAVTCGGKEFKVWGIAEVGGSEYWVAEYSRSYKGLDAGAVCYSSDGSLVGATFGRIVTVWDADALTLKLSLCHQRLSEDVRVLEFGENVDSHLILSCSDSNAAVWDVITASLLWVVPVRVDCVAMDRFSSFVCAASGTDLILLKLFSPEPVRVFKDVSKTRVCGVGWLKGRSGDAMKSHVLFLNGSDEVCGLLEDCGDGGEDRDVIRVKEDLDSRLTGFGIMVAEKRVSNVNARIAGAGNLRSLEGAYSILREMMDSSPHTMPSMKYYATQLLRNLSVRSTETQRLAQMEELVMASSSRRSGGEKGGGKKHAERDNTLRDTNYSSRSRALGESLNTTTSSLNSSSGTDDYDNGVKWDKIDLDEVATEDHCWIDNIFKL